MESNELRIGNIVNLLSGEEDYYEIRSFDNEVMSFKGHISWDYIGYDEVEAIPLTEEWLLKFGFLIKDKTFSLNYGGESMRYALLDIPRNPFILWFHGRHGFNTQEGRKSGDYCIQYVHQLQNLYFALTGKEIQTS